MKDKPAENRNPDGKRKRYAKPSLHRYGAIRAITENVGNMTLADNGSQPKVKTN
jgi:hypothetical protein